MASLSFQTAETALLISQFYLSLTAYPHHRGYLIFPLSICNFKTTLQGLIRI